MCATFVRLLYGSCMDTDAGYRYVIVKVTFEPHRLAIIVRALVPAKCAAKG